MSFYPRVLTEDQTLDRALTNSLARYGDGELKLILGKDCVSQKRDPKLADELRAVLASSTPGLLVGIPNVMAKGTKPAWQEYRQPKYTVLYPKDTYASSFITRPDSAPWIDTQAYWNKLSSLWVGKSVVLVKGTERSLRVDMLAGAADVRCVDGPRRDAYEVIDQIEEAIGSTRQTILLCLGPTATVLAARLAKRGMHAVDLGHVGMFMRHAGAYAYKPEDLISNGYKRQIELLREQRGWGGDGWRHAGLIRDFITQTSPATILDYGCGEGKLREALAPVRVMEYDPGVQGKGGLPKPCDLVVSTDVLEHVEPDKIDAVLDHIFRITAKHAFLIIATREANATLPDGRNAHLIVKPAKWWIRKIMAQGWKVLNIDEREGRDVKLWLAKP